MTLFRCTASGVQVGGLPWSMRLHFSSSASVGQVEIDWNAQASSFWNDATHGVQTLFPTGTTMQVFKTEQLQVFTVGAVQKLRSVAFGQDLPALAGTSANDPLPAQDTVLVSLLTGLPGRENRGRFHLPAPDETLVTLGELDATSATRVKTSSLALHAAMAAAGHTQVIVTYKLTKIGTPVGASRPVTGAEVDRIIRSQRARTKGVRGVYV